MEKLSAVTIRAVERGLAADPPQLQHVGVNYRPASPPPLEVAPARSTSATW